MTARLIEKWGAVMRLARRAALLASEEQRRLGRISDPLDSSIMLYTDDPVAAGLFYVNADMAAICKTSAIENVCIVGKEFPPASHEAERDHPEQPRIAAMWFPAPGEKCPRCRNYTRAAEQEVCMKCSHQITEIDND